MRTLKLISLTIIVCFIIVMSVIGMVVVGGSYFGNREKIHDTIYVYQELSGWELFTLATIQVESKNDPMAFNAVTGAAGCLQITPIYVDEYNRITCSNVPKSFTYTPQESLLMWEAINDYYNPERDYEKATYIHNPKAGDWYRNRIYSAMDDIERYEKMRRHVTEICYGY